MSLFKKEPKKLNDLFEIIKERSKAEVTKDLVSVLPGVRSGSAKRGEIRIQPAGNTNLTDDDLKEAFKKINLKLEALVPPKAVESKSSKFPTYVVKDAQGKVHYIVFGGGAESNAGMSYERQMAEDLQNQISSQKSSSFFKQFKQIVGDVKFTAVNPNFSNHAVRRQLTDEALPMGKIIADIILVDSKGKEYFISLKNISGKTIANNSLKQMFTQQGNRIITKDAPSIDPLLKAVKLDKLKIAKHIEDFLQKKVSGQSAAIEATGADTDLIKQYLASAFDYGYYYVREKGNDQYEIHDFSTLEQLLEYIGEIERVSVKYPYYAGEGTREKRKNASIIIETSTGMKFSFDLRNASGGVVPTQINLVKL